MTNWRNALAILLAGVLLQAGSLAAAGQIERVLCEEDESLAVVPIVVSPGPTISLTDGAPKSPPALLFIALETPAELEAGRWNAHGSVDPSAALPLYLTTLRLRI